MTNRKYTYKTNTIEMDTNIPVEEVKATMAGLFPEVANAQTTYKEDGSVEFVVSAGSKGASRKYTYKTNTIEMDTNIPVEEVKATMAGLFPEVANAQTSYKEDGSVEFVVSAGSKGN